MVKDLLNLMSTNNAEGKKLHVTVINDSTPCTVTLKAHVCESLYSSETVALDEHAQQAVSIPHDQSGWCAVRISEERSNKSIAKYLYLDAPEAS